MSKNQLIIQEISDFHVKIVDEYLSNGHNKAQTILKFHPDVNYGSCHRMFNAVIERPEVAKYLKERQTEHKEKAEIKSLDMLLKLKTWLNSDPSQFINLTPDQVKELPAEVRQCIQAIDHKKKEYTDRQGVAVVEHQIKVTLVDKVKTMDMLNKHIGFYSEDNKQKGTNVNMLIQNLALKNPETLNLLLKAIDETKYEE
jgi:hypothetical protein